MSATQTKSARYHARRRARLITALGGECVICQVQADVLRLEIDHIHGGGNEIRSRRGHAGEVSYLLALPSPTREEYVQLLCQPCHVRKTHKR